MDSSSTSLLREQLLELVKLPQNSKCADCFELGPQWASVNLGIFICIGCAGIHRNLSTSVSRVKSLMLDIWKPEEVQFISTMGNENSNGSWEASLPSMFVRPSAKDSVPLKEQFIRAKYVRKLYVEKESGGGSSSLNSSGSIEKDSGSILLQMHGSSGSVGLFNMAVSGCGLPVLEGFLTKKGEVVKSWKRRFFRLNGTLLSYYKKPNQEGGPTGTVCLAEVNEDIDCLLDPIDNHVSCFKISIPGRNYYLSADNPEAMYEWIMAIRAAYIYLCKPSTLGFTEKASPESQIPRILDFLNSRYIATHKKKINGRVVNTCFWSCTVVDILVKNLQLESRKEGILIAEELVKLGHVRNPSGGSFQDFSYILELPSSS